MVRELYLPHLKFLALSVENGYYCEIYGNMSLEEFKQINLDKYIEQVLSMCEDILDDEFDKDYLKNIINNSYKLFMDNISMTDVEFIIDNYISKISLYISNKSFGK